MTTRRLLLLIGAVGVVAIGMWAVGLMGGLRPAPAADPGCAPIEGSAGPVPGMPCAHVATLVGQNHGYLAPGGQADGTLFGSDRWGIDSNQGSRLPVAVIGDTVVASGVPWARVYVPSSPGSGGDADVFTWLPLAVAGELRIVDIRASECPATRDNPSTLGVLDPITRARCLGAGAFTITGRSGRQAAPVAYDVEPAWLSGWSGDPAGFSIRADPFGEPIDVQQHGGTGPPPGFVIELTAHVGDAAAHDCRRTRTSETYPVEAREDSVVWCLTRIVADRWNAVLGPEDRPIDPRNPQLHRHDPLAACAGVTNSSIMRPSHEVRTCPAT